MGQNIVKNHIIDPETGEIIKTDSYAYFDGFTEKGFKYRSRAPRITIYPDCIPSSISADAYFLLIQIAELANEENALVYRVTRKSKFSNIIYKPMYKDDIRKKLRFKIGINKFNKCWNELKKHCIKEARYHEYMCWVINPAVVFKSAYLPAWLYDEFSEYLNPYLSKNAIKKFQNMLKTME